MTQFLVIYDRISGHADVRAFSGEGSDDEVMQARFEAERTNTNGDVEIVSLAADDLDELKATHSRYFRGATDVVGDFERLLAS